MHYSKEKIKWLVWLLVFLLVFSTIPLEGRADVQQTNQFTEKQKADQINLEINKNQPSNIPAPPPSPAYKGELTSKREENAEVIQNEAGDYTKKIYMESIHYKNEQNKWQDISTTLRKKKTDGDIEPESTTMDVSFEQQTSEGAYAKITNENNSIQYSFLGAEGDEAFQEATDVEAEYKDNKIWYKNVLPSTDLRNVVFDQSIKEDIVLNKNEGLNHFKFHVKTSMQAQLQKDGSIEFKDEQEKVIFTIPKPFMSDSNINIQSGEPQTSDGVSFKLDKVEDGYILLVLADKEWLTDPNRVYPIYIDPSTTLSESNDTFVSSAYPSTTYEAFWESSEGYYSLKTGYYDGTTGTNYSFVKPNISKLSGAIIDTATFNIYTAHSYYPATATGVWLDRLDGNWASNTLTWNSVPPSVNIASTSVYRGQTASFNVLNTVRDWVYGNRTNYGFKLHANGNGQTYWKKFYASENSTNKPYLSVDYHYPTLDAPQGTVSANNNGTGYINLSWNSVKGATGYKVWIYNGTQYESFDAGATTSWTSKGKGIWPTATEIDSGRYSLHHDAKGTDLANTPTSVYKNSGGPYGDSRNYFIRISATFPGGETGLSYPYTPILPMDVPKVQTEANPADTATGYVNLTWEMDPLAKGYKVWVYNGVDYEAYDVKDTNHWSTQGKKIWPTAAEISSGRYALHHDNLGTELPKDPSPVYKNSGGIYGSKTNYWFRVTSYMDDNETPLSSPAMPTIPSKEASYLGTEDFWPLIPVAGGAVNAFSGNLVVSNTDFDLTGRGPGIEINRTYNSQDIGTGLFGKGWYSTLDQKVAEQTNGDVLFTDEDNTIHRFRKISTNLYEAPFGIYLELTKDGNGFYLKDTEQSITSFDAAGKIISEKDANGNKVTYQYSSGKLTSITDASGRIISLQYQTDGYVSGITYENRIISYTYNTGNLTEVKTPENRIFKYGYENGKLRYFYDPRHTTDSPSVTEYVYTTDKLTAVKDVLLKQTTLSYNTVLREVTVTKPKGTKDVYTYSEAGNSIKTVVDSASLKLTTTFQYENNNLIKKTDPKDQGIKTSESYQFDEKGNVTQATDAVGTEKYEYNTNNDITKAIDTEGDTSTVAYEDTNAVSETDTAGETASVTHYDTYGNVTESSSELAPSRNYVSNPSFENGLDSSWIKNSGLDSGMISVVNVASPARGLSGGKALRLDSSNAASSSAQHGFLAATQVITVKPNTTYTLSGLIKAEGLEKAYAFYNVQLMDAQSQSLLWMANRHNKVTGTTKWLERQLSFTTTENTAKVKIYLEFEHRDSLAKGTALFDAIQLEEGPVSASFNPVVNSGFEQSATSAPGWTKSSTSTTNNGIGEGFSGSQGIYLQRNNMSDTNIQYSQEVVINQTVPKNLTVTGMSKAEKVANSSGQSLNTDYSLWADVTFTDGTTGVYQAKYPLGTHDWNRSAVNIPAKEMGKSIQKVKVSLIFRNGNTGKAFFDDVRLIEGNVLSKKEYDAKSNYVSAAYDELGNKAQFQYDLFGNKTSETDPNGNNKTYECDTMSR